jgi:selenocysteine-specific elongation factor
MAGHIDHGKTALLQALTGAQGDLRREERERGITIDLGYRYAESGVGDGDDALTAFIDMPGHERFIHNLLAGTFGIDLLLLVVAADDGVMPQTREHLAIAELLGTPRALVAVSKADRVDAGRVAQVCAEVAALMAPGPLADAPQFVVSSRSGEGLAALRHALTEEARRTRARYTQGYFRLGIDRAFSVAGAGVVVTGTALAGQVRVGDELLLGPTGRRVRVRGLHAQNREARTARAGQRVALNLAGERLAVDQVQRGDWLLDPTLHAPTTRIDIRLRVLPSETRALRHWTPVHVHLGAQDVTGRVALLEGETLEPGATALAQLLINAPAHAAWGDALVLRDQSAQRTLGGAQVIDPFGPARQRRSPERLAQLQAMGGEGLEAALPALLRTAVNGLDAARLERQYNRPRSGWKLPDDVLRVDTRLGPRLYDRNLWQALGERLQAALQRFHEQQPDELGPDRDRLRRFGLPALERPLFIALLETQLSQGLIHTSGPWLHMPEHRVSLSAAEQQLQEELWPLLHDAGFDPPWVRDISGVTGRVESQVRQLLRKLARLGLVQQVVKDLFYPQGALVRLAHMTRELEVRDGVIHIAAFRDMAGIGRKRSVQLLEHFDRVGLTRRSAQGRLIRPDSALLTPWAPRL